MQKNVKCVLTPMGAILASIALALPSAVAAQDAKTMPHPLTGPIRLHNGWTITPAGTSIRTTDMLLGCVLSPDGQTLAMTSSGYNDHALHLVDPKSGSLLQKIPLERTYYGIAWSRDSRTLYLSGGALPQIQVFRRSGSSGKWTAAAPIPLPNLTPDDDKDHGKPEHPAYIAGLALSPDGTRIYVVNLITDAVFAIRLADGALVAEHQFSAGSRPYCVRVDPKSGIVYVTEWANRVVVALHGRDLSEVRRIPTGSHPNDILLAPDGRMFVSCGNDDAVYVLDPQTGETRERILTTLTPRAPAGATPNALALSPDGKTLYVADADNNDIAVIDVSHADASTVKGFIPTGWYPTSVAATRDGKRIIVGVGKGTDTYSNSRVLNPDEKRPGSRKYTYIAEMLHGMIETVPLPDSEGLARYTKQVLRNTPYRDSLLFKPVSAPAPGTNAIPSRVGDPSPIKHILYIIKENRTYDQVLGDLKDAAGKPMGNGDPNLTLFGEAVTPNQHALARQFVTLDNLYASGEVSGNGHPLSTGAYSPDINERSWVLDYSGKARMPTTERVIYPPAGRIWDVCERYGLSFASYYITWTTDNTRRNMPAPWQDALKRNARDAELADVYIADLKGWETSGEMPSFMIMSLREDHTTGTTPGNPTPQSQVASNDQGVGKIVEAISKSSYWANTAIFIIEDDAQDGADHVDAHRTIGQVISAYTKRGFVDSTPYTTMSMLRTMELILGLPPMSEYDASATPMYAAFTNTPNRTPFDHLPPGVDLDEKNTAASFGAEASLAMDFTHGPDLLTEAEAQTLNRILWHSIRGVDTPYPAPVSHALISPLTGRPLLPTADIETGKGKESDPDE